jgi:hypothetical protein
LGDAALGSPRIVVGLAAFALGALCFMLVPVQVTTI